MGMGNLRVHVGVVCLADLKWVCPVVGSLFKNEDELTRKFKMEKEYQVFVKMDKRVPGTK